MIQRLLIIVGLAALAWGGYWVWGAQALEGEFESWFEERRAEGWQSEYSDLSVRGFPNRFDTTWENISIVDPETGLGWEAPFFQLFSLSYNPGHLIAVWPDTHRFLTPGGAVDVSNDRLRASLVVDGGADQALNRANLEAQTLTITTRDGETTSLASVLAGISRIEGAVAEYRVGLDAGGLALSAPLLARLGGSLPETFKTAKLDMLATFDRPWDVAALEDRRPQPTRIDLSVAEAEWGPMMLRMAGEVDIDTTGTPSGSVTVRAQNWEAMVDLASASGAMAPGFASGLTDALGLVASLSGNRDTIDVELKLARGMVLLGPIPLGPAPKITLR